ncbi:putative LPS assembly protein LptD [Crocinitomix sp.]|nr:putative LPS assembly protein LptD [Crocinitomix sp.]
MSGKLTAQDNVKTGSTNSEGLNSPVNYQARDSIVSNIPNQTVKLYGESVVIYEDIELRSDVIEIFLKTNEVIATYSLDSLGNPVGKPVFSSGGEESVCDYIKYNFETNKGIVREVRMQQGEGYIHMNISKVHPNEQIHFKDGKFTTCDKEKPHFHFNLTRAIVIPDKRIVTGPVFMEIMNIPTPLAAPFGFFPNSDTKKAGLILPEFQNGIYGFGLENIGYYVPISDNWETYFYGSIFTTGSWAGQNITNYYKKYKYRGNFGVRFEQFRGKFYDTFDTRDKWTVNWQHNQDAKAHPSLKFSSNINFVSDNTAKTSLDAINTDFYNNTFNSSVNLSKSWKTRKFRGSMGMLNSLQQNSQSGNYIIELPHLNLSVSRFDLGVLRQSKIGQKWYEKITVTYSANAKNSINAPDSIFNFNDLSQVGSYSLNGLEHRTVVQSNLRLLGGRFVFTPSVNYRELWNFQYEERSWNPDLGKVDTSEFNGFKSSRDIAFAASTQANFYGYYKMKGNQGMKFRHVASPNLSFTYRPDIGLYQEIQIDTTGRSQYYSPFNASKYRETGQGSSGRLNFGVNNTLEMKKKAKNDTINDTMKAFKLIDALSANGSYDLLKDSMNLSNFALAFRTSKFFSIFSFQSSATLSPYSWVDSTGITNSTYAWREGNGIGRITNARGLINANFTNKKGRDKQKEADEATKNDANKNDQATNPQNKNYSIPWVLNLSYNVNYLRQSQSNGFGSILDTFDLVQTISADGNINLNEKWKIDYYFNYDLQENLLTNFNIGLWRDLHCWETSLFFQQNGRFNPENGSPANWSVQFKIGVKASMFQDIKYDQTIRNPFPF